MLRHVSGYSVVDTEQINCYANKGGYTIATLAPDELFAGQDAEYAGLQPRYQDNGDGTLTDLKTGLMWQKAVSGMITWPNAVTNAVNQTTGGYTDWCLPTIKELYSLIDFSGSTGTNELTAVPYFNTDYFDFVYGHTDTKRYVDA